MISIRAEIDCAEELQSARQLKDSIARNYAGAIESVADYAVEVDSQQASEFRKHLFALQTRVEETTRAGSLDGLQSSFRGELREYQIQVMEKISRLHSELAAAAVALQSVAASVTTTGTELEAQVNGEIQRLEAAASTDDLTTIQAGIREATAGLKASCEQLQRSNHVMVALLQDELRTLHKEIAEERRALNTDRASGAWTRQKTDTRVAELLKQREAFWILFTRIEWKDPQQGIPQTRLHKALRAVVERLEETLGSRTLIGRWEDDVFAAIIESEPADEREICTVVQGKMAGPYAVQEDGLSHSLNLNAWVAAAARAKGTPAEDFYLSVGHVIGALSAR